MFRNIITRVLHKLALIVPGGGSLRPWLHRLSGANIGKKVWIGQLVYIDDLHPENLVIGDNCTVGLRTSIFTHFYWGPKRAHNSGKVVIENDVFVGPHCVILPNVRIGEGAVIKAGTVVTRNVPPHAFWGSPGAELLGVATAPLTAEHDYTEFQRGLRLRPPRRSRQASD